MHRAGTSVVARALQALGVDLGDSLMSANLNVNARGFFEDNDLVKLDDELLAACGADWKNVALLDTLDWRGSAFVTARTRARHLLEMRLSRSGQFGFKDPRVARLLPFWQGIFADMGVADAYVIALRHPLSVIDSLTARDALDVQRSGWLWLTHLVCALHYTAGRRRVVVDYDRLLAAPEHESRDLARAMLGWLVGAQHPDGRWASSAWLRFPPTEVIDPGTIPEWHLGQMIRAGVMQDERALFTTATVLTAIARAAQWVA